MYGVPACRTCSRLISGLVAFAIIAGLTFVMCERGKRKISVRDVAKHAFPSTLFRQPSSRADLLHTLLQFGLWEPLIALLGAVIVGVSTRELLIASLGPESRCSMACGDRIVSGVSEFLCLRRV